MALGKCSRKGWTSLSKALIWDLGIWLLIYTYVCWGVFVPEQEGGPRAGMFTCFSNIIARIDCHWSAPELAGDSEAWLLFTSNLEPGSRYKCTFWGSVCTLVLPPEDLLLPSDNFTITFHRCISGQEQISLVDPQYLPWRHVKLDPPCDLQSNVSSGQCVLTWSISPELEPMSTLLSYELAFKRQEEAWEWAQHKDHIVGVTSLRLEAIELKPGSTYEARLRVQMVLEGYLSEEVHLEGHWSEWSLPVCFLSPQQPGLLIQSWGWSDSTLVAVSVFLLLTGLIHLLFKLSPRVKRTFYKDVPSPAAFFHSLYSVYNGDFQTWTGGVSRARPQATQDGVNSLQGDSESGAWEDITVLTYGPVHFWQFSSLEEGLVPGFPGPLSSEHVLPADCVELGGQPSAYLPQEDWAPECSTRLAPPDSEGCSSDYYTLGYDGECGPSTLSEDT